MRTTLSKSRLSPCRPAAGAYALVSILVLALSPPASAQGAMRPPALNDSPPASAIDAFQVGDRLRIDFFEHLELGSDSISNGEDASARSFYQRMDLTGEYVVEPGGSIAIPLLGRFQATGQSIAHLQAEIGAVFGQETGREGEVYVAVVSRRPVFVTGLVRNPGAYEFAPGMLAIQAIALAGGVERVRDDASRLVDALREVERRDQARKRLDLLRARKARLMLQHQELTVPATAEQARPEARQGDGETRRDTWSGRLTQLESDLLESERSAQKGQANLQAAMVASARGELSSLEKSRELVDRQIDVRVERLNVLKDMQDRHLASFETMWTAQRDVADFELQREQLASSIHVARQKLDEAKLGRERILLDFQAEVVRQLAAVEEEIAALETTAAAAGELSRVLEQVAPGSGTRIGETLGIEILRRRLQDVERIAAEETSELRPGDVVKVLPGEAGGSHSARASLE